MKSPENKPSRREERERKRIPGENGPDSDERAFNETLKKMLKTPPKPHEKPSTAQNQTGPDKAGKSSKQD